MSMKKTDLVKQLAKKLDGRMKTVDIPGRFAQGSAEIVDRREQRRRDAAAGLVPFACKLPAELVKRLNERATSHEGGVNAWIAEAIEASLKSSPKLSEKTAAQPSPEVSETAETAETPEAAPPAPGKAPRKAAG